jgi:hypothetical protein
MNIIKLIFALVVASILSGCAHSLNISPNMAKIEREASAQPRSKQSVGYYIPADIRSLEVTTPGGGGDKVSYSPYRDIETAFYKMLTNVFDNVTKLNSLNDAEAIGKNNIGYVITPEIITNSSSSSAFTWPPTKFSVELTCKISDTTGKSINTKKVVGEGHAEFDEFKADFSLSARRASEDALLKMQSKLQEMK